jgi:hypothetical protein
MELAMRLIETTPVTYLVRLKEHPGHPDQKVHGRKGSGHAVAEDRPGPQHVNGLRRLVDFHTRESTRIGGANGWLGRSVETVRAEIASVMGGGEPLQGFNDFALWAEHTTIAVGLSRQMAVLGATP